MLEDSLIFTYKQSLKQTRIAQSLLMERLESVRSGKDKLFKDAERLYQEIDALDNCAKQTESTIAGILDKKGKK